MKVLIIGGYKTGTTTLQKTLNQRYKVFKCHDLNQLSNELINEYDVNDVFSSAYFQDIIQDFYEYSPFNPTLGGLKLPKCSNCIPGYCNESKLKCEKCINEKKEIILSCDCKKLINHYKTIDWNKYQHLNTEFRIKHINNIFNIDIENNENLQIFNIIYDNKEKIIVSYDVDFLDTFWNQILDSIHADKTIQLKIGNDSSTKWYCDKYVEFLSHL